MGLAWAVGLLLLTIGLSMFLSAPPTPSASDVAVGLMIGLPGLWLALRVPFMRVACRAGGVVHHGLYRTLRYGGADVESVELATVDGYFSDAYAAELRLRGRPAHRLTMLARYSVERAQQDVDHLTHLLLEPAEPAPGATSADETSVKTGGRTERRST